MDSGVCASNGKDPPHKYLEKSGGSCNDEADKEVVELPMTAKDASCLGPITPVANREIGDFPYECTSPPTSVKKPSKLTCFHSDLGINKDPFASIDNGSPKTPKEGVFDPFAPGPDDMVLAPICKKYIDKMRTSVARRLKFDYSFKNAGYGSCGVDVDSISDEEMFESVYENLLETIVSKQAEGQLAEIASLEWDSDGCMTPPLASQINGVAETCPGAPMKPTGKPRNIDLGFCRKLEFQ